MMDSFNVTSIEGDDDATVTIEQVAVTARDVDAYNAAKMDDGDRQIDKWQHDAAALKLTRSLLGRHFELATVNQPQVGDYGIIAELCGRFVREWIGSGGQVDGIELVEEEVVHDAPF